MANSFCRNVGEIAREREVAKIGGVAGGRFALMIKILQSFIKSHAPIVEKTLNF
jgi:hypothetical protein